MVHGLGWRRAAAALALLVALTTAAPTAWAHAILVDSTPAVNAAVGGPALALSLRYNSRIDKGRSKLTLIAADKTQTTLPIAEGGAEDVLTATADGLKPGTYTVRWQVLAIDGHITRGDVPFTVKGD